VGQPQFEPARWRGASRRCAGPPIRGDLSALDHNSVPSKFCPGLEAAFPRAGWPDAASCPVPRASSPCSSRILRLRTAARSVSHRLLTSRATAPILRTLSHPVVLARVAIAPRRRSVGLCSRVEIAGSCQGDPDHLGRLKTSRHGGPMSANHIHVAEVGYMRRELYLLSARGVLLLEAAEASVFPRGRGPHDCPTPPPWSSSSSCPPPRIWR
jgi:hypothetical protein